MAISTLMRAMQISNPQGKFELVKREIPVPLTNEVLIKVEACGVCYGEAFIKEGFFSGLTYPRIPGHEVIGKVAKLGSEVDKWKVGDRVGVGWHGGYCHKCKECLRGNFWGCEKFIRTGITRDGGYAEYMTARSEAMIAIPAELESMEGAVLVCSGRIILAALKDSGAQVDDVVAIHSLDGLGQLAVQYAVMMGFKTVVLSNGIAKEQLAYKLGAHAYIDTTAVDVVKKLNKLKGARAILCLPPNGKDIPALIAGLEQNGKMVIITAAHETMRIYRELDRYFTDFTKGGLTVTPDSKIFTMEIPIVDIFPLEQAAKAYNKMMNSKVLFRKVLKMY